MAKRKKKEEDRTIEFEYEVRIVSLLGEKLERPIDLTGFSLMQHFVTEAVQEILRAALELVEHDGEPELSKWLDKWNKWHDEAARLSW